jgi:hypothetical protein
VPSIHPSTGPGRHSSELNGALLKLMRSPASLTSHAVGMVGAGSVTTGGAGSVAP